jgi:hypothetical protein
MKSRLQFFVLALVMLSMACTTLMGGPAATAMQPAAVTPIPPTPTSGPVSPARIKEVLLQNGLTQQPENAACPAGSCTTYGNMNFGGGLGIAAAVFESGEFQLAILPTDLSALSEQMSPIPDDKKQVLKDILSALYPQDLVQWIASKMSDGDCAAVTSPSRTSINGYIVQVGSCAGMIAINISPSG